MIILFTAFNGKNNSSKILLDNINATKNKKLYLKNSFKTSVEQLENILKKDYYDYIISFGQAPLEKNTIKIELQGSFQDSYKTNFDYNYIKKQLELNNYNVLISNNAGKYLCNNIYYHGLKYINKHRLKNKIIFIHIPDINNITDITNLSNIFNNLIYNGIIE